MSKLLTGPEAIRAASVALGLDERQAGALLADAIERHDVLVETVYEKGRKKELVHEISLVVWCNEQRRRQDREPSF